MGGWGRGGDRNKRAVGFLLFLRPIFGYLLQNLSANVFYKLLEGKIVLPSVFNLLGKISKMLSV